MDRSADRNKRTRHTRDDWVEHGLITLAGEGFTGLKADRMVKTLGVSRGSFYHHFPDIEAFHQAVLNRWLEVTVLDVVADLDAQDHADPAETLTTLIALALEGMGNELEQAIRAWGFSDPNVRASVALVDERRIAYVAKLIGAIGHPPTDARSRAVTVYMSSIGYAYLGQHLGDADRANAILEITDYACR